MSNISFRLTRSLLRSHSIKQTSYRCFSTTLFCQEKLKTPKPELLSDERLQEKIAELERPLNLKSISIDDTREHLLSSVESFRPTKEILTQVEIDKLIAKMSRSFTVAQLQAYIKAHMIPGKGNKKQDLMERIISQHWGLQSAEKIKQERLEKLKDRVSESLPATLQQLFFVIGENGETMKRIEDLYDVGITVDVEKNLYMLEGQSKSVARAKKELEAYLKVIKEEKMDLPEKVKEDPRLMAELDDALISISQVAGSFITLKDNKINIASISDEKSDNAKRLSSLLLTELGMTDKKALNRADQTYVHDLSEYTVLPLHDSKAMPLHNQKLAWDRLKFNKEKDDRYRLIDGQEEITFDKLGEKLLAPIESSNLSLEARFGYLLFQNVNENQKSYYRADSKGLSDLFTTNRTAFFPANPPSQITVPYSPLSFENGFHERSVKLEYVHKSLLYNYNEDKQDLERVEVELKVGETGQFDVKSIIGEKGRRTIDVLGVQGQIDIRLIAKNFINYNNELGDLIEKCKLISHNDIEAPKSYDNFLLSDITFMNKKLYMHEDNLISLQHSEQQDGKAKRTEMIINSVNPETLNAWPSFSSLLTKVASQWDYSRYT